MSAVSQNIDRTEVVFDEPGLVANAGLMTVATLVGRLGLERLINKMVRLTGRVGGANAGGKILTLVVTLVAGGSHIDHVPNVSIRNVRSCCIRNSVVAGLTSRAAFRKVFAVAESPLSMPRRTH